MDARGGIGPVLRLSFRTMSPWQMHKEAQEEEEAEDGDEEDEQEE